MEVAASLQNLAAALSKQGSYAEAVPLARQAHEIFGRVAGPGHVHTALPLLTLAEIHLEQRNWIPAATVSSQAAEMLRQSLPQGHFITAVAKGRLGRALAGQQRYTEAERLLRESLRLLLESEADTSQYVEEMRTALAGIPAS